MNKVKEILAKNEVAIKELKDSLEHETKLMSNIISEIETDFTNFEELKNIPTFQDIRQLISLIVRISYLHKRGEILNDSALEEIKKIADEFEGEPPEKRGEKQFEQEKEVFEEEKLKIKEIKKRLTAIKNSYPTFVRRHKYSIQRINSDFERYKETWGIPEDNQKFDDLKNELLKWFVKEGSVILNDSKQPHSSETPKNEVLEKIKSVDAEKSKNILDNDDDIKKEGGNIEI